MSESIETTIRVRARDLLEQEEVSCVIGYERGPRGDVRPAFVYQAEDAERLVWNQECDQNLMVYLHDRKRPLRKGEQPPRVAIVAKPCDVRALNVLLHEEQVTRERVFVIGIACPGMWEDSEGSELQARCSRCKERVPVLYDTLVGEPPEVEEVEEDWADLAELEAMTAEERLAFWVKELQRCIRCYACRQACPGCYCYECVAEQVDPAWVAIAIDLPEVFFYHVMRAYHLAGRCVECDACERACPVGIPLSLLNRKFAKEVADLFDYQPGGDPEIPPPLATFKRDEDLPL
jgi:formate dehydrogenase subunit beta